MSTPATAAAPAPKNKAVTTPVLDLKLPKDFQGVVTTRFPPEPSGYLHIGHAKAALINYHVAKQYNGKLLLRFDDTNPKKEKEEFVDNIFRDLKTLGIEWDQLSYTSDHFDLIMQYCDQLLAEGKAYVDATPVDEMRKMRMDGIESTYRSQSVEENIRLWNEMKKASEEGLKCCVRAKISMTNKNKALRDPTIFRCNLTPHHRTGDKYVVYPTYDMACPIVDSLEGVTHAMRTNEYRDRNDQYNWFIKALNLRPVAIRDYSRLNFVYTTLSKRKLTWFVDTKRVDGWDDPRMPTVQGIMNRGMTVEALRDFVLVQGFSQASNMMEWDKIWTINKRVIDPVAPRFTAIAKEATYAVLELFGVSTLSGTAQTLNHTDSLSQTVPLHPKNASVGTKVLTHSGKLLLEVDDAATLVEGEEITLMALGNAIISSISRPDESRPYWSITATYHPEGDFKKTEKKLTWIDWSSKAEQNAATVQLIDLDTLITTPKPDDELDFTNIVNERTWIVTHGVAEAAVKSLTPKSIIQFNRRGYFILHKITEAGESIFINIPDGRANAASTLSSKVDKAKTVGGKKEEKPKKAEKANKKAATETPDATSHSTTPSVDDTQ